MSLQQLHQATRAFLREIPTHPNIHSINDPWLGVDVHMSRLPQGLIRIMIIALPTTLIPRLASYLHRIKARERLTQQLFTFLAKTGELWTVKDKRSAHCLKCKTHTHHKVTLKETPSPLFTLNQVKTMYQLVKRSNEAYCKRRWQSFMKGRVEEAAVASQSVVAESLSEKESAVTVQPTSPSTTPQQQPQARVVHRSELDGAEVEIVRDLMYLASL